MEKREIAVLFIVHSLPPFEHSGTPLIAYGYARHLAARAVRVGVLYVNPNGSSQACLRVRDDEHAIRRYEVLPTAHHAEWWSICEASADTPRFSELDAVLDDFRPTLVHIVDLVNLPVPWPARLKARQVPTLRQVWNAEDICGLLEPIGRLPDAGLCPPPLTPQQCAECCFRHLTRIKLEAGTPSLHRLLEQLLVVRSQKVMEFERHLTAKRRQAEQAFCDCYDRIVFPTQSFREFFEHTLPLPPERTVVVEPGIDVEAGPRHPSTSSAGPVRFLFLGNLTPRKGIDDLIAVFSDPQLLGRTDYELTLYAGGGPVRADGLLAANPRVRYAGSFTPDELQPILEAADVGLSPSRFETFHRVTREYLAAGLAVIGSTAFGIPDAVRHEHNGLLFQPGDAQRFRDAVLRVLDEPGLLARLRDGARQTQIRTVEEEMGDLLEHYRAMLSCPRR